MDETKASFKTTEFWAMVGVIAAILVASAVSDSLDDVRAWTLLAAVAIGYMLSYTLSPGLAQSGNPSTRAAEIYQAAAIPYAEWIARRSSRGTDSQQNAP